MANTLSVQTTINNSTLGINKTSTASVTTTGDNVDLKVASVTTSEYTWTIDTDIGDVGYVWVRNIDSTNYVQVGFATTDYKIRLLAGQTAVIPVEPATSALYLKANTATCLVEFMAIEA